MWRHLSALVDLEMEAGQVTCQSVARGGQRKREVKLMAQHRSRLANNPALAAPPWPRQITSRHDRGMWKGPGICHPREHQQKYHCTICQDVYMA